MDILAVEWVMSIADRSTRQAIEIVYFADAGKALEKNDISTREHKAEIEIPASEHTVYRRLAKAQQMFAEERELRLYNKVSEKLAVHGYKRYNQKICESVYR